jgi:hypothetical protein
MRYLCSGIVAVLLTASSVHVAGAQSTVSALTNADVIRYVALGISDRVMGIFINEATATKFDLSPAGVADLASHGVSPAVIAAMRRPPPPAALIATTPAPVKAEAPFVTCSPAAGADLRRLANTLRASNADDDDFIRALDKAVHPDLASVTSSTDAVTVGFADGLLIQAVFPYGRYRSDLIEALRKKEPIEGAQMLAAVEISVYPSRTTSPDIIRIVVERDGKAAVPIANTLAPTELTSRWRVKVVIHSGGVLYPCSAFAAGAKVTVTAIPRIGSTFTKTFSSAELATLK